MINPTESGLNLHQRLNKTILFNELGDRWANRRRIVNGSKTNLMELGETKYKQLMEYYDRMMKQTWNVEAFNMFKDRRDYEDLSDQEKKTYDRIVGSAIFLESELLADYDGIKMYFSAPEAELVLSALEHQTAYHTYALAHLVKSTLKQSDIESLYNIWRTLDKMRERNKVVNSRLLEFMNNPLVQNFLSNLYTIITIQKVFVPTEFSFLYSLSRRGKLSAAAEILKRIQRDLDNHCNVVMQILTEILKENTALDNPEFRNMIVMAARDLTNAETDFTQFLTEGAFLGLNELMMAKFAQAQANKTLKLLQLEALFPGVGGQPIPWFESYTEIR